jgi:hypothetical protein
MKHLFVGMALVLGSSTSVSAQVDKGPLNFETHVRPILKANCFECHGETEEARTRRQDADRERGWSAL